MRRSGEEVSANDYLTFYLKNFKANFNAQLCMIETFSTQIDDLSNMEQKIQKAKQSAKSIYEAADNQESAQWKVNWKLLQRFCLRINEYIEYRVSKTKAVVENSVVQEVNAMCVAMHRVFSEINKGKCAEEDQVSLSSLFAKIGQVENQYMVRILKRIIQLLKLGGYHQNISQVIDKIEKLKELKMGNCNKHQIEKTLPTQSSTNYEKKIDFSRRLHDSHYASKLRSRKSTFERIQNMPSISNASPGSEFSQLKPTYNSHLLLRNPEDLAEIETKLTKQNRLNKTFGNKIFSLLTDVVQIGNDLTCKYSEEGLMRELLDNNKANLAIIQKFRKKSKKIKLKLDKNSPRDIEDKDKSNQSPVLDIENRHKRSYTLDASTSKPNVKKEQKFLGFPSLKRKSVKI